MSVVDGGDGLVDRVSDDQRRPTGRVGVVEHVALRVEATAGLGVVGWCRPDEAGLGRSRTLACTAVRIADANGPLHVDEFPVGDVDGGASVDDEF